MQVKTRRLTPEDWIAAARKVLMSSGVDDVKVDRLSREMKVTRGSFYWHFDSRKSLLDALLHDWEVRNLHQIDYLRAAWAEDAPDLAYVSVIYLGGDQLYPAYDMAIRIWARKSPLVAAAVGRIDDAWIGVLKELFVAPGVDETEAFVRARINYFHQIGYYALAVKETIEERARLVPYYYKILSGKEPSPLLHRVLQDILAKQRTNAASRRHAGETKEAVVARRAKQSPATSTRSVRASSKPRRAPRQN